MKRVQKTTKAELVERLVSIAKDQFLRMNYAIMTLNSEKDGSDSMYDELASAFNEVFNLYLEFPECFDERETEILSEYYAINIADVDEDGTINLTDEQVDRLCELENALFEYYNGCEEELEEDLPF